MCKNGNYTRNLGPKWLIVRASSMLYNIQEDKGMPIWFLWWWGGGRKLPHKQHCYPQKQHFATFTWKQTILPHCIFIREIRSKLVKGRAKVKYTLWEKGGIFYPPLTLNGWSLRSICGKLLPVICHIPSVSFNTWTFVGCLCHCPSLMTFVSSSMRSNLWPLMTLSFLTRVQSHQPFANSWTQESVNSWMVIELVFYCWSCYVLRYKVELPTFDAICVVEVDTKRICKAFVSL